MGDYISLRSIDVSSDGWPMFQKSTKIQLKSSTFSGQNWSCSASYYRLKLLGILKNLTGNGVVVPV